MGSLPDLIFVIDTVREQIAIKEANKLNIPIAAIIDTNSDPEGITYPIPGNDDARRSIDLYCNLMKSTINDAKKNLNDNEKNNAETKMGLINIYLETFNIKSLKNYRSFIKNF